MKNSLIAVLGFSPPVVTKFVKFMVEGEGLRVTDLTVVTTEERQVLDGLRLVEAAVRHRYPWIHFHEFRLPFEDVRSVEETYRFMGLVGKLLHAQKSVHGVDSVHLCLAGGRKDMGITAALMSQYFGVNGVYHIIMPDIQVFNAELELLRSDIERLAASADPIEYYRQQMDVFEPLMFPPLDRYVVIKIPLIPYPASVLRKVFRVLKSDRVEVGGSGLPADVLSGPEAAGLVRVSSKGVVRPLEQGKRLLQALSSTGLV
jgi:CRISPR-associated Csx14 family protein